MPIIGRTGTAGDALNGKGLGFSEGLAGARCITL